MQSPNMQAAVISRQRILANFDAERCTSVYKAFELTQKGAADPP